MGAFTTWADDDYMQTYFEIDTADSTRSGLQTFDADAGFKDVGLNLMASYKPWEHWGFMGLASYKWLLNDAEDSRFNSNVNNYSICWLLADNIKTQKGESQSMVLPFLLSSTPICRASSLTADLRMRYGSDIHLVSERVPEISKSLIISIISLLELMCFLCKKIRKITTVIKC